MANEDRERLKEVIDDWAIAELLTYDSESMAYADINMQIEQDKQSILSLIDRQLSDEDKKQLELDIVFLEAAIRLMFSTKQIDEMFTDRFNRIKKALSIEGEE